MLLLLLTLVSSNIAPVLSQCYRPDHTPWTKDGITFQRCPQNNMCCALGREAPPGASDQNGTVMTRDVCLPNGLCENRFTQSDGNPGTTKWWRNSCTDSSWDNSTCLSICVEESFKGESGDGHIQVTPCDGTAYSEKWCCGDTKSCCTDDGARAAVVILPTLGMSLTSSVPSSIGSATNLNSQSTTPISNTESGTASTTPISNTESGTASWASTSGALSAGAKAGIAVGAIVGALSMLGLGYFIARVRRKRKTEGDRDPAPKYDAYAFSATPPAQEMDARGMHELPATQPRIELPSQKPKPNFELP